MVSLGTLWSVHEVSLEFLWFYDMSMGFLLGSLRFPWYFYAIFKALLWDFHGASMVCLWDSYGIPLGFQKHAYGVSIGFLWGFFGISMTFLLDFYDRRKFRSQTSGNMDK